MFAGILNIGMSASDYILVAAGCALMLWVSIVNYRAASVKPAKAKAEPADCGGRSRKQVKLPFREALAARPEALQYAVILLIFFCVIIFGAYGVGFDSNQFIYNQF